MENNNFDTPLHFEPDGSYITEAQMQFFLNRTNGEELFTSGDPEFFHYFNTCRVYNLVSEVLEEDEKAAFLFWDEGKGAVSLAFPRGGRVEECLQELDDFDVNKNTRDQEF